MKLTDRGWLSLVVIASALAGCGSSSSSTKPTPVPRNDPRAESALRTLERSYASTPNLTLEGQLQISGVPATIWFDALVKAHDSMKIVLTGPFSMPVGAMSASRSSFLFFNPQTSEVLEGRPDRETFRKLILVGLDYNEMVALLRGEVPTIPAPGAYSVTIGDDGFLYQTSSAGMRERFLLDPDDGTVTHYERARVIGDSAATELMIDYSLFTTLGGRKFPKKATVDITEGPQRIRVTVDKMKDSVDPNDSYQIDVPPEIPRKRI